MQKRDLASKIIELQSKGNEKILGSEQCGRPLWLLTQLF